MRKKILKILKSYFLLFVQITEFNFYITEVHCVTWLTKLKIPSSSNSFRMSHDEPAKKLKLFHVRKLLINDWSLTTALMFPCISCFAQIIEALLAAKALMKHGNYHPTYLSQQTKCNSCRNLKILGEVTVHRCE